MEETKSPQQKTAEIPASGNGNPIRQTTTLNRMTGTIPMVNPNLPRGVEGRGYSIFTPDDHWPPPVYIDPNATPQELYYIEHRWYKEWSYYDKRATEAKRSYQRLQLMIGVLSAGVPVLVSIQAVDNRLNFMLYLITIVISFAVAAASAIEQVRKYGDMWRSYRAAAEELHREKALYDVKSGSYRRSTNPFLLFVERCEEVIGKQNGAWSALKEEQIQTLDPNVQMQSADMTAIGVDDLG